MAKKKDRQKRIILFFLIGAIFLMIAFKSDFFTVTPQKGGIVSSKILFLPKTSHLSPLTITTLTDKTVYSKGDLIKIEDFQELNKDCKKLVTTFSLKQGGNLISSETKTNQNAKPSQLYYQLFYDSSNLIIRPHIAEVNWFCDSVKIATSSIEFQIRGINNIPDGGFCIDNSECVSNKCHLNTCEGGVVQFAVQDSSNIFSETEEEQTDTILLIVIALLIVGGFVLYKKIK